MDRLVRLAVFSDTHGNTEGIERIVRQVNPDVVIHLGDYDRDAKVLQQKYPHIPVYSVCGNCDYGSQEPTDGVLMFGRVSLFITHGHLYNVREELDTLAFIANKEGCQIALYGHTHVSDYRVVNGVTVINPGTAGVGLTLSWAKIVISENGLFTAEIHNM